MKIWKGQENVTIQEKSSMWTVRLVKFFQRGEKVKCIDIKNAFFHFFLERELRHEGVYESEEEFMHH